MALLARFCIYYGACRFAECFYIRLAACLYYNFDTEKNPNPSSDFSCSIGLDIGSKTQSLEDLSRLSGLQHV